MLQCGRLNHSSSDSDAAPNRAYLVIGWNDSVNLMEYAVHALQMVFNWHKSRAHGHIMEMHNNGKSVLTRENAFENAEHYVHQLQSYGIHATLEREE
jgi:ATP-dependent Clp protease adaptor protein ClpS